MIKNIDKMVDDFIETTEGLVSEGVTSLDVEGGTYEVHMKPFHKPEVGEPNIFQAEYLSKFYYKWMIPEEISNMVALNEYPLNIRTLYYDDDDVYLLTDTRPYLVELPEKDDIEHIVEYDLSLIESIGDG